MPTGPYVVRVSWHQVRNEPIVMVAGASVAPQFFSDGRHAAKLSLLGAPGASELFVEEGQKGSGDRTEEASSLRARREVLAAGWVGERQRQRRSTIGRSGEERAFRTRVAAGTASLTQKLKKGGAVSRSAVDNISTAGTFRIALHYRLSLPSLGNRFHRTSPCQYREWAKDSPVSPRRSPAPCTLMNTSRVLCPCRSSQDYHDNARGSV
ncbi:hypothetical protein AAFF_G00273660 [Aldrovandia affinis]|uniref:Uncharacterized protein n=1 Tax=Aldrovandia affinis TaxID=143900 RepID=A0AAD7SRI3_9TELE|nr:hypothetical protein AAFF_G00273660 [Aldrovandia affinis]